jgi:hypothetical protein
MGLINENVISFNGYDYILSTEDDSGLSETSSDK